MNSKQFSLLGQISEPSFVNDDFSSQKWRCPADVDLSRKNTAASMIDITELKDAYDKKELKGGSNKLITSLREDDNPLVMILTFR
jgi:hypothetical protein